MEQIMNYVKPELVVVAIVLYFIGVWLKQAAFIKDKYIPLVLGIAGIFVCGIWVMATASFATAQDIALAVFTAIVQGILVAGLSTYVNQIIKQLNKEE
ncbi:MAG: phage holin family protein [Lachnospiraceae bacterium]